MGKPPRHRHSPGNKNSPYHHAATVAASPAGAKTAHHHHHQQQSYKAVISSNSSIGSAPSAVMCVPASPLARELSDLSGSYMNGNTAPRSSQNRSFGNSVCSEEPVQGFWRQAYLLSSHCPREQPIPSSPPPSPARRGSGSALIVVERNGVIELVKKSDGGSSSASGSEEDKQKQANTTLSSSSQQNNDNDNKKSLLHDSLESAEDDLMFLAHNSAAALLLPAQNTNDTHDDSRIPILILLMDPGRKQYEIMQLWVDPQTDLVRDILLALQRKLSDKWRQDYDGLFQLRGNQYCQLVHILSIAKYDIRPRELWVAKPWSMAAKTTIELAKDCVGQLKAGGLLSIYTSNSPGKKRIKKFLRSGRNSPTPEEDGPLTLSDEAMNRMWFPDGIMKHHHACQFLSFRVPAIPSRVMGQPLNAHNVPPGGSNRGFLGSLLYASQSFDDASSQLSNPSDVMLLGETPTKLNSSSSSAASPSSGRRKRQGYSRQQRLPTPVNLDSKWQPSGPLEDVAEVIVNNSAKDHHGAHSNDLEEAPDVSTILADLETTNNNVSELNETHEVDKAMEPQQPEPLQTQTKKEQRCSFWTLFAPLNCAKRRSLTGGSRKGDDGYSSSWGGDGSSSGAKNSKNSSKNSNNQNYNDDGRESPTSTKGSADCDDANDEDTSIVSDSAPLLSTLPRTSSSSGSVTRRHHQQLHGQALHQLRIRHHQTTTMASASPFARYYK